MESFFLGFHAMKSCSSCEQMVPPPSVSIFLKSLASVLSSITFFVMPFSLRTALMNSWQLSSPFPSRSYCSNSVSHSSAPFVPGATVERIFRLSMSMASVDSSPRPSESALNRRSSSSSAEDLSLKSIWKAHWTSWRLEMAAGLQDMPASRFFRDSDRSRDAPTTLEEEAAPRRSLRFELLSLNDDVRFIASSRRGLALFSAFSAMPMSRLSPASPAAFSEPLDCGSMRIDVVTVCTLRGSVTASEYDASAEAILPQLFGGRRC